MKTCLFFGGTEVLNSNRMFEIEGKDDLVYVSKEVEESFEIAIKECRTVDELIYILETMKRSNINIVGSRGYTYSSEGQADNIRYLNDYPHQFNLLTRALGIRSKYLELIGYTSE